MTTLAEAGAKARAFKEDLLIGKIVMVAIDKESGRLLVRMVDTAAAAQTAQAAAVKTGRYTAVILAKPYQVNRGGPPA